MNRIKLTGLITALSIAAAACSTAQATTPPEVVDPPPVEVVEVKTSLPVTDSPDTTSPQDARPARTLDEVEATVVQIVANGSFETPEGELVNVPGSGTGFVIAETGLAVTNNHVVTGAAYLDVYVADEEEPRNAQVLGVSECSDLAVIDIEGEFTTYLEWHDGPLQEGLDVYVAGFPLGDPKYTLYDGIIAKSESGGESAWASVANELEHSANTRPGNSGSPIVTDEGTVVGVHYASGSFDEAYGISMQEAATIVERLRQGEDVASIGINGEAFRTDSGFSGIWVSSVDSGSPAADAGVEPGDILSRLENLVLAEDGTMADYCKILRSHDATDELSMEVLRLETGEILTGTLNGSALEVTGTLDANSGNGGNGNGGNGDDAPSAPSESDYVTVAHNSGALTMDVPAAWTDVESGAWKIDGERVGMRLGASPDMDSWRESWATPGVEFQASAMLAQQYTPDEFLDTLSGWSNCTYDGRFDYDDGVFTGRYDQWSDCGSANATYYEVAAVPADGSYLAFVEIVELSDADHDATLTILGTFMVEGAI